MPSHPDKERDPEDFTLGQAIAAALSGFAGTGPQFVNQLSRQIQNQLDRKERESQQSIEGAKLIAPLFEANLLSDPEGAARKRTSESIPLTEGKDGSLVSDPSQTPEVMTGDAGIDAFLRTAVPASSRADAAIMGKGLARSNIARDEALFQRDLRRSEQEFEVKLQQRERELLTLKPVEAALELEADLNAFHEMEPHRFDADKKRALLSHNLALQRQQANIAAQAGLKDIPTPRTEFEAIAIGEAQQMATDPRFENMPIPQYRQELLGRVITKANRWGARLPDPSHRAEAINQASRFWNPKLRKLGSAGSGEVDIVGAMQAFAEAQRQKDN